MAELLLFAHHSIMAAIVFHAPLTFLSFLFLLFLSCFPAAADFYRFGLSISFTLTFFSPSFLFVLCRSYLGFPRMAISYHRAAHAIPSMHLFMRLARFALSSDGSFETTPHY